jgi:hypothetical protein
MPPIRALSAPRVTRFILRNDRDSDHSDLDADRFDRDDRR